MHPLLRTMIVLAQILGGLIILVSLSSLAIVINRGLGAFCIFSLTVVNAWAVYAFLQQRQSRQDELAQVFAAAVAGGVPLAPAVRSYASDLPHTAAVRHAASIIGRVVLPVYGYARLWIGLWSFEELAKMLADRLESGESLADSLQSVPGVASREVCLAAAVGEATGALGQCLANTSRERWSAAWLEVAPRLLYPFFILEIVFGVVTFLATFIMPRYKRIFDEFGMQLPGMTRALIDTSWWFTDYSALVQPAIFFLILTGVALTIASPTIRWYTPLLGRLYRWGVQAEILRALGRLLAVGQTVPASLAFMVESGAFPPVVQRRLNVAEGAISQGEPLDAALRRARLLPAGMVPLVQSAGRVGNLPWALVELGDHLAGRAFRLVRQLSLVLSPLMVIAIGAVVLFVVVAMFLPLIKLLEGLSR